jgi:hypothetical protein
MSLLEQRIQRGPNPLTTGAEQSIGGLTSASRMLRGRDGLVSWLSRVGGTIRAVEKQAKQIADAEG